MKAKLKTPHSQLETIDYHRDNPTNLNNIQLDYLKATSHNSAKYLKPVIRAIYLKTLVSKKTKLTVLSETH